MLGEEVRELPGGVGCERLAKTLAVIDNGLGVFGIENGFKFLARGQRRRRILSFFLSSYIFLRRTTFYAHT
jgi:hypothetical protein